MKKFMENKTVKGYKAFEKGLRKRKIRIKKDRFCGLFFF